MEGRRVGIGAAPSGGNGQWHQPQAASLGTSVSTATPDPCPCADPRNWWSTGKRFSLRRVIVCLVLVALIAAYTFFGYSQSPIAQQARQHADHCCPGISDWAGA